MIALFLAILPANIYAANAGIPVLGKPATPLVIRIPLQLVFIAMTWWSGVRAARR